MEISKLCTRFHPRAVLSPSPCLQERHSRDQCVTQIAKVKRNEETENSKAMTITRLMSLSLVFLPMDGKELNEVRRCYSDGGHEHSVIRTSHIVVRFGFRVLPET